MTKENKRNIIRDFGIGTYKGIYHGYLQLVEMAGGGVKTVYTSKKLGDKFGVSWFHAHQHSPFLLIEDYVTKTGK